MNKYIKIKLLYEIKIKQDTCYVASILLILSYFTRLGKLNKKIME